MALLSQVAPTCQSTPADITEPLIQVAKVGGQDDGVTEAALIVVGFFGVGDYGYDQAKVMAAQAHQVMLAAGGAGVAVPGVVKPVLIDSVRTVQPPAETPGDNPELRRKVSTFQVTYRRPF